MKLRKLLAATLACAALLTLASCGNKTGGSGTSGSGNNSGPVGNSSATGGSSTSGTSGTGDELTPINNYPAKSLQITVPPSAGGGTDVLIRAMTPKMEEYLGVPITVVNKSGGGCAIGYAAGAEDPNDGSCITAGVAELLGLPYTTDFNYTYHDFEPICNFNSCYGTICVPANAPYNTIEEFVEYAKANPGVRFANSGIGGPWHILAAEFAEGIGAEVVHVPCDGGGPAATACAGGNVEAVNVSDAEVKTYVDSNLLKMLLTFSPEPLSGYPDVPLANDKGLSGSSVVVFRGFLAPKGTSQEVIDAIDAATRYALADPDVQAFMESNMYTNNYMNAADFQTMLDEMDAVISDQCTKLGLSK